MNDKTLDATANRYIYKAVITRVYDGDTITANVDMGLNVWLYKQRFRLFGIDAPELKGEEREAGLAARDALRIRVLGETVLLQTFKDKQGSFGRWLAIVFDMEGGNVNNWLVASNYAVARNY